MNTKGVGRCLSQKEREIQTNGRVWVIEAKGEEAPEERSIGQMLGPLGLCKAWDFGNTLIYFIQVADTEHCYASWSPFNATEKQKQFIHSPGSSAETCARTSSSAPRDTQGKVVRQTLEGQRLWGRSSCCRPKTLKKLLTLRTNPPEPQFPHLLHGCEMVQEVVKVLWSNFPDETTVAGT